MMLNRFVFPCEVVEVSERKRRLKTWKNADGTVGETYESLGFYVTLSFIDRTDAGEDLVSTLSWPVGPEKPDYSRGQKLRFILEP